MSQQLVTPWIKTNVTGAYVNTTVISTASGLATSGVIVLMGEASGGPGYNQVALANNFFGPTQANLVQSTYLSGPLVDAFRALGAPSNDPDITGTANSVYIVKTNNGTHASATVDTDYGTMSDRNYGTAGNLYQFTITSIDSEVAPSITGNTIPSYSGLSGAAFTVRVNGGPATVVTPMGTITDLPSLLTSLNAAFATAAVDLDATAGTAANTISINWSATPGSASPVADTNAYRNGWGKSFELIDSTPGDLAALGLVAGLTVSSQEPGDEVNITRSDIGVNQTINVEPNVALMVGYEGTTATITITSSTISTTVTGGSGTNLSIPVSQYTTIGALATFINSQPGYTASSSPSANQIPPSALDNVTAIGICSTAASDKPGRVKDGAYTFATQMAASPFLSFTPTAVAGIPNPQASTYLSGGQLGATLASDIVAALAQIAGVQCNIIVPLFSQDATADIAAGNTDPSSTYTIDAINELVKSQCLQYSTPELKRNRMGICSFNGTFANIKAQSQSLASYRITLTFQQVTQVNSAGANTLFLPWYAAVLAAGMQCGGFYKSIDNHYTNAVSYTDPSGYNSTDPSEVETAVGSGLLSLTQDTGGIRWVNDQTTYGIDANFVYNSIQAVYLSDILALDLAQATQVAIVGKSLADIGASNVLSFIQQRFDYYKKLKIVTSSSDAPLGYRNVTVQISAPSVYISLEAKLTTSVIFAAIDLALSAVQQSAS